MRATVCQLREAPEALEEDWASLVDHVLAEGSDLVLLPEMPFHPWLAASRARDAERWAAAVDAHERWAARLGELGAAVVAGSRPATRRGEAVNEGFVWEDRSGLRPVHEKRYLPDEPGFWEASWYRPGEGRFDTAPLGLSEGREGGPVRVGFLICTDLWFPEHARAMGRAGAHLLLAPRATPEGGLEKWLVGGRASAIVGGAWCLSSNRSGPGTAYPWGGGGWIVEPEGGEVVGVTSRKEPFVTREVDPGAAEAARATYPRYVR